MRGDIFDLCFFKPVIVFQAKMFFSSIKIDEKYIKNNNNLVSTTVPGAKDEYGRLLCLNDAETLLVIALNELQPDEDWEVSEETRKRMFCSLKRDFGKLRLKEEMRELLCSKYKLIEIKLDPKDDDILIRANMKLKETHALWGSAPNAFFHPHVERLSVRGNFRKVRRSVVHSGCLLVGDSII